MNSKNLNNQVENLFKRTVSKDLTHRLIEDEIKPEYIRLLNIGLTHFDTSSILMIVRMNLKHAFVNSEQLASEIDNALLYY